MTPPAPKPGSMPTVDPESPARAPGAGSRPARPGPEAPGENAQRGTARWLNAVTTLLLATVAIILAASAGPSLLRASVHAGQTPQELAPPVRQSRPPLVPHDHPMPRSFDRDADDPRARPPGISPTDPRARPPRFPGNAEDDDDGPGLGLGLKGGVTLRTLLLRDRRSGTVLHEVQPGKAVSILREDDDWVLVVQKTEDDDIVTGWAKRSELLLR